MLRNIVSIAAVFAMVAMIGATSGAFGQGVGSSEPPSQGSNSGHVGCAGDQWGYGLHKGRTATVNNSAIPIGMTLPCMLDILNLTIFGNMSVANDSLGGIAFYLVEATMVSGNPNITATLELSTNEALQQSTLALVNVSAHNVTYTTYNLSVNDPDLVNDTVDQVRASVTSIESNTIFASGPSSQIICYNCGGNGGGGGGGSGSTFPSVGGETLEPSGSIVPDTQLRIHWVSNYGPLGGYMQDYECLLANAFGGFYYEIQTLPVDMMPITYYGGTAYTLEVTANPVSGACSSTAVDKLTHWSLDYYANSQNWEYMPLELQLVQPQYYTVAEGFYGNTGPGYMYVGGSLSTSTTITSVRGGFVEVAGNGGSIAYSAGQAVTTTESISYSTPTPCNSGVCGVAVQMPDDFIGVAAYYSLNAHLIMTNEYVNPVAEPVRPVYFYSPPTGITGALVGTSWSVPPGYTVQENYAQQVSSSNSWTYGVQAGGKGSLYGIDIAWGVTYTTSTSSTQNLGFDFQTTSYGTASNSMCQIMSYWQEQDNLNGQVVNGPVFVKIINEDYFYYGSEGLSCYMDPP